MTILVELFGFVLWLVQEVGVLLGVGAEMILLVSYLLSLHGTGAQARFVRPARFVERIGLGAIIGSGFGVVLYQVLVWQTSVLTAPAFMGKWLLIGIVLFGYKLEQIAEEKKYSWRAAIHGFIGGTWLALFVLHTLAPDTTLVILGIGYVLWMLFFTVVWSGFVTVMSPQALVSAFKPLQKPVLRTAPAPAAAPAPTFQMPKFSMPTMPMPSIALPKLSIPTLPRLTLPKLPSMPPKAPVAAVPEVYKPELMPPVAVAPAPTHVDPAPAPHKPAVVVAAPAPRPVMAAPAPSPEQGLPAILVMPRSPEQLKR